MDEIRRLENQIRELQNQLRRQNEEAARMRQGMAAENLKRLQEYQKDMETKLDQHDKRVQKEYERLLKEYQSSVDSKLREEKLKMDSKYQALVKDIEKKEKEWKEKVRQMDKAVAELKKKDKEKEEASKKEARKYISDVEKVYQTIDEKPHEAFYPKRIQNYQSAIADAKMLLDQGLNEAAIAVSISTGSGLRRLGYDIDDRYQEWIAEYELFKQKTIYFIHQLNGSLINWMQVAYGKTVTVKTISKEESLNAGKAVNFWSNGKFKKIQARINTFAGLVGGIEKEKPEKYVKKTGCISIDELKKNTQEMDTLTEEYNDLSIFHVENYNASCERADWGEEIISFFIDELNLTWLENESHFKAVETPEPVEYKAYMLAQYGEDHDPVDVREWLELSFANAMDSRIYIYIVPYTSGTHVENRIVVYINYVDAVNEDYSRQIYGHICECLNLEPDDGTLTFATEVDQLVNSMNKSLREAGDSIKHKIK